MWTIAGKAALDGRQLGDRARRGQREIELHTTPEALGVDVGWARDLRHAVAVAAAAAGRDAVLARLGRHRVWPKGNLDIVTDADLASREAVRAFLARTAPTKLCSTREGARCPAPRAGSGWWIPWTGP